MSITKVPQVVIKIQNGEIIGVVSDQEVSCIVVETLGVDEDTETDTYDRYVEDVIVSPETVIDEQRKLDELDPTEVEDIDGFAADPVDSTLGEPDSILDDPVPL